MATISAEEGGILVMVLNTNAMVGLPKDVVANSLADAHTQIPRRIKLWVWRGAILDNKQVRVSLSYDRITSRTRKKEEEVSGTS